ncbi:MAG: DNA primase [Anaerolineae bacterium]
MTAVEEIHERADIIELIGQYVGLKRSGRNYKGLCPFHSETVPSFMVFPESAHWRCFGACAVGGDIFDFVMRIENTDFPGALDILARRYGVSLEPLTPQSLERKEHRELLREATVAAKAFFHAQLMRSAGAEVARDYLNSRGLGSNAAAEFGLGWAPDDWTTTINALRKAGHGDQALLDLGLARERDSGGLYSGFRDRLMFPIHDARGRPIGFGARTLDPDGVPKYVNSPQSELFDKSSVLYGIEKAARGMRESKQAVVVEGYTDVIRAHMAGYSDVVASLGTAVTEAQLNTLKKHAERIVLALDADAAGQAATLRGLDVAREAAEGEPEPTLTPRGALRWTPRSDVDLRVARLPAGQDPDDVIRDDPGSWSDLVGGAKPMLDHLFEALTADLDLSTPDGKMAAADLLLPAISTVQDSVARSAWVARLADMIRMDERTLANRLMTAGEVGKGGAGLEGTQARRSRSERSRRSRKAAEELIREALADRGSGSPIVEREDPAREENRPGGETGGASQRATDSPQQREQGGGGPPPGFDDVPFEAFEGGPPPEEYDDADSAASVRPPAEISDAEPPPGFGDVPPAGLVDRPRPGASGDTQRQGAPAEDTLVASVLGQLLVEPRRLFELSAVLAADGQPPLSADELPRSRDRHVLEGVRHEARGAVPPDVPPEQRLREPPPHMAPYLEHLRRIAAKEQKVSEARRIDSLRLTVLRLRERERRRDLEGLRFLLSDVPVEDKAAIYQRIANLTAEINVLQGLRNAGPDRKHGKLDADMLR